MKKESTKETLEKARAKITDPANWTQGDLVDAKGRNCAIGAINEVLGLSNEFFNYPQNKAALSALAAVLPNVNDEPSKCIYCFNDARDHACVLEAFDAAIETL